MQVQSLGWEDSLNKKMVTHSNILAQEIPWTEDTGGLQSTGSHKSDMTQKLNNNNNNMWYVCVCVFIYIYIDIENQQISTVDYVT